jgi:hypothetical protein
VLGRRSRRRTPKALDTVNDQLAEAMAELAVVIDCESYAWYVIVNYIAVMQRVAAKSPPELIRDCAMAVQLSVLLE